VTGTSRADLRRALRFVRPYWRRLALVLALSLLSTALSLSIPLLSRDFFDRALIGRDATTLVRIAALFALVTILGFAVNVVSGLRYTRVSADILFDMRLEMYRHLQQLSPRFYARTRIGDILSRINNDIGEIQRIASEAVLAWIGNVLFLVGTVAMLAWLDIRLFVVTMIAAPASIWALVRYRSRLEGEIATLRQRGADIGSFLIETLQGMRLVVTSNAQGREVERFRGRNDAFVSALMSMQRLTYLAGGLPGLIFAFGTGVVFVYGGWRVITSAMTMGTFVAFMAYQMRVLSPVQALMSMYTSLATVRVSLGRVSEILDEPIEIRDAQDATPLAGVRGDVTFDGVSLSHDRGAFVLDDVSFAIRAGETVAIVGPSGSGKSTLADLLLRLVDPNRGIVCIDGRDVRTIALADLRRAVALVEQEPFILHGTIAENVRYARPDATNADIAEAVRQAALDAFVATLPQGLDTVVGERGMALSAGERQRLAAARAFLIDPAILVLDEPTAALDAVTEDRLVAGYEATRRGRTTIVITHRPEVARRADRVLVVDGSRVLDAQPA
jgi:ATP-binding cassette subfamily B protein